MEAHNESLSCREKWLKWGSHVWNSFKSQFYFYFFLSKLHVEKDVSDVGCQVTSLCLCGMRLFFGEDDGSTFSHVRIDYVLGKNTWVERWPSPAECSSNTELGKKCKSLNDAVAELSNRGCGL
uniref:NTR domain-containing protein n=1 Tax=Gouania willdenowi TaxID=441366 RepID=A0A8C5DD18_GOUWI